LGGPLWPPVGDGEVQFVLLAEQKE